MNFVQFYSSFAPKNGPLVHFIVQFFTIEIQEIEELSSVQVPKNQVNFMNLVPLQPWKMIYIDWLVD